jgi:hypothetical protein
MSDTRRQGRASYLLDGQPVMSVTTILSKGLPKPALIDWAARTVAGYVADHWDWLKGLDPDEVRDIAKDAHHRDRDKAANRGTEVHRIARALIHDEEVQVPEELAGHVKSCVRFLDDWQPRDEITEVPVFSRKHRYAGTFDMHCTLPGLGRTLLDVKTNRSGPFGEVGLQLAAYGHADVMRIDGQERPMPPIDAYAVVWLRADGYDVYQYAVTDATFRTFLYCQQVAHWLTTVERGIKGPAIPPPSAATEVPA